jgi:hypothetical protein
MSATVYKLVIFKGYKEAWYQLSKEDQDRVWAEVEAADKQAGGEIVLFCDSRWADEAVAGWGVVRYSSIEGVQHFAAQDLEWWRYAVTETFLGTEERPDDSGDEGQPAQ